MNKPEYQSQNETKLSNMPPRPHQAKGKKKVNPAVVGGAVAGAAVLGVGGTAAAMSLSSVCVVGNALRLGRAKL